MLKCVPKSTNEIADVSSHLKGKKEILDWAMSLEIKVFVPLIGKIIFSERVVALWYPFLLYSSALK